MRNFQDTVKTRKRSFISAFSICIVPLRTPIVPLRTPILKNICERLLLLMTDSVKVILTNVFNS